MGSAAAAGIPDEVCAGCRRRNRIRYSYTRHTCGGAYRYIPLQKHLRAHRDTTRQEAGDLGLPEVPHFDIFTSDPDEIKLIRRVVFNLLGPAGRPRPLEGMAQPAD